jgi:hypothetical protein
MSLKHPMCVLVIAGVKGHCHTLVFFFDRICLRTGNQRSSNKLQVPLWVHIQSRAFIQISIILHCVFYHWDVGKQIYDVRTYQEVWLFHWYAINILKCRVFLTKVLVFPDNGLIRNVDWSSCKVPRYFCPILIKLEFSARIFENNSNIRFHENPSTGSRVVRYGQTETRRS